MEILYRTSYSFLIDRSECIFQIIGNNIYFQATGVQEKILLFLFLHRVVSFQESQKLCNFFWILFFVAPDSNMKNIVYSYKHCNKYWKVID